MVQVAEASFNSLASDAGQLLCPGVLLVQPGQLGTGTVLAHYRREQNHWWTLKGGDSTGWHTASSELTGAASARAPLPGACAGAAEKSAHEKPEWVLKHWLMCIRHSCDGLTASCLRETVTQHDYLIKTLMGIHLIDSAAGVLWLCY
jgi:hypothetical protein